MNELVSKQDFSLVASTPRSKIILNSSSTTPLVFSENNNILPTNRTQLFLSEKYETDGKKVRCILKTKGQGETIWKTKLRQEFSILQRLQQIKYVVKVFDYDDELQYKKLSSQEQQFLPQYGIIMEDFTSFIPLKNWYETENFKQASLLQKLKVMKTISKAIYSIHQQAIFHKYINPSHILIDPNNFAIKIIDFSHASIWKQEKIDSLAEQELADKEKLLNEMMYWSPELTGRMNRLVDYRTDLYSLGILFYELLSGSTPFEGEDLLQIVYSHIAKKPKPLSLKQVPLQLSNLVLKLIEKNPESRYHSALSLMLDLKQCISQMARYENISNFELDVHGRESTFLLQHRIYARDEELGTLLDAFGKVSQGSLEVVLVEGYSGIGKSSLVQELYRPLVEVKGYFISGKQEQMKMNIPFFSLIQAMRQFIKMVLSETKARALYWKQVIVEAVTPNGKLLTDVVPDLELLIGDQPIVPELNGSDSTNRFVYTCTKLFGCIASKEHPLILFLDDLQWADQASLKVFASLANSPVLKYFMLIGSFRNNEVSSTHLLSEAIRNITAPITRVVLKPLQKQHILQLVRDSFGAVVENESELSELVMQKTEGNPFFAQVLLSNLYEEQVIQFDDSQRIWRWSASSLHSKQISENVVDVMIQTIQRLDKSIQRLLSYAALIGSKFDVPHLAFVAQLPEDECLLLMKSVTDRNLVLIERTKDDWISLKFAHDRIQQSALNIISTEEKKKAHLQLGQKMKLEEGSNIFDVTNHLNNAVDLLDDSERLDLAKLNLQAALKAKRAVAFSVAASLSTFALQRCLPPNSWSDPALYQLTFQLSCIQLETEYLSENFPSVERYDEIIKHIPLDVDKLKVYSILLNQLEIQSKFALILDYAKDILSKYDIQISLDADAVTDIVKQEFAEISALFQSNDVNMLIPKHEMNDRLQVALLELLQKVLIASFILCQPLYRYLCVILLKKTMEYGKCVFATVGIMGVGMHLGEYTKNYELGRTLCNVAMELTFAYNDPIFICKNALFFATSYSNMLDISVNLQVLEKGLEAGLSCGNFLDASYACINLFGTRFFICMPLDQLIKVSQPSLQLIQKFAPSFYETIQCSVALMQRLQNVPEDIDVEAYISKFRGQQYYELSYYGYKLYEHYYIREELNDSISDTIAKIYAGVPLFYSTSFSGVDVKVILCLLIIRYSLWEQESEKLDFIRATLEQVKLFSTLCASNYSYRYLLLKGEVLLRIDQKPFDALEAFHEALTEATKYNKTNYAAMAHEHIMQLWIHLRKETYAGVHLKQAMELYGNWKADAVVLHLKQLYFGTLARANPSYFADLLAVSSQLDTQAVVKASQAISSEVDLSKLLQQIMRIIVESSLSEKAVLLIKDEEKWIVLAQAQSQPNIEVNQEPIWLEQFDKCPHSLVHFVEQSKTIYMHGNVIHSPFHKDPYFSAFPTKSILCIPLIRFQQQVQGMIYLENGISYHAFSNHTVELMQLLSSQIVISIQNAISFKEKIRVAQEIAAEKAKQKEAEEYKQRINEFVDSICHEIRNPLFGCFANTEFILDHLQTILQRVDIPSEVKQQVQQMISYSENIIQCCTHEKVIIDDTLNLSKLEANKLELHPSQFNPVDLVNSVLQMLQPLIAKEKLYLQFTKPKSEIQWKLSSDSDRIRQVLLNLLSNAIKFTHEGGITVQLELEPSENNTLVTMFVKVKDTGIGIAKDELANIFHRFQQANKSIAKQYGGSGLGLPLCKKLLQLMGGDIKVESESGQGSTFTVWIPCQVVSSIKESSPSKLQSIAVFPRTETSPIESPIGNGIKDAEQLFSPTKTNNTSVAEQEPSILIVEDNIINQKVLQKYVSLAGYKTDICNDGLEAIEKITNGKAYRLCFMDIQMPRCSGIDATKAIRKWETEQQISTPLQIVGLSGYARKEYVDNAISAGMNDYITKPFDRKTILMVISKYMQ